MTIYILDKPATEAQIEGLRAQSVVDVRIAVDVELALIAAGAAVTEIGGQVAHARLLTRNFYSSLRVEDVGSDPSTRFRRLLHGGTEHGTQFLDPQTRRQPTSYYSASSGIALAVNRSRQLAGDRPISIGVVGLGTGAIAA